MEVTAAPRTLSTSVDCSSRCQTNNAPPEAVRLGMCVERKLGDRQSEMSYTSQLRNRYPDAPETRAIAEACE